MNYINLEIYFGLHILKIYFKLYDLESRIIFRITQFKKYFYIYNI